MEVNLCLPFFIRPQIITLVTEVAPKGSFPTATQQQKRSKILTPEPGRFPPFPVCDPKRIDTNARKL